MSKASKYLCFTKDIQVTNCYEKKNLLKNTDEEMQIKTTMRYYLIPVTIDIIISTKGKCWQE